MENGKKKKRLVEPQWPVQCTEVFKVIEEVHTSTECFIFLTFPVEMQQMVLQKDPESYSTYVKLKTRRPKVVRHVILSGPAELIMRVS